MITFVDTTKTRKKRDPLHVGDTPINPMDSYE